jgi:hypothetical protein
MYEICVSIFGSEVIRLQMDRALEEGHSRCFSPGFIFF